MQFLDQHGRKVQLSSKIGTGGEGTVFEIAGTSDFVAKIYHKCATPEKSAKLAAMATLATKEILSVAAWPTATLHQAVGGPTVGIVLPRVKDSREIHELYSPAHRKVHFPRADWRFLIRVARNCAAAFATLHGQKIVIGDVNQGNVFVSSHATIKLIDCDSFQLVAGGRLFRCPVGVAHFIPPELQDTRLSDITRTVDHDNFGLAIILFHLLFMGRHPYSGRYGGPGDMPIEKAIKEYRFAYSGSAFQMQMAPPLCSLTMNAIPSPAGILFERAFSKGSASAGARPSARTWVQALTDLENRLKQCGDDPGHAFFQQLSDCPWCTLMRSGGPNFFISVSLQSILSRKVAFDLSGIWRQIEAVPRPDQVFVAAPRQNATLVVARPLSLSTDDSRGIRNTVGIIACLGALFTLLGFISIHVGIFSIAIAAIFGVWWMVLKSQSPIGRIRRERHTLYRTKATERESIAAIQKSQAQQAMAQFKNSLRGLMQCKAGLEQLSSQRDGEIRQLHQQMHQRQLDEYLRQCFISDAQISGIGPMRIAALESHGIETAYDVSASRVRDVQGFGDSLTARLLDWRQVKVSEFRFNPAKGIPPADLQAIEIKYAQLRAKFERRLEVGPSELSKITQHAKAEVEKLYASLARLEFECSQALADVRACDSVPWWH